ncbi:MAG: hypothetical protein V4722_21390 [Bacteroidota bacterium]
MKMKPAGIKWLAFIVGALMIQTPATAQPSKEQLEKWSSDNPQEKVFLQTDKDQYFEGETIWMKAWCALDGTPTFLSRILYVDMVNANGDVVLKKMYKLDSLGSAAADFDLAAGIPSGKYSLNAYTLWMLNFPGFIFSKSIFVYGADYINKHEVTGLAKVSLQFFPEGGDMVAGIKSKVAFKAHDGNGYPIALKGSVKDNTGKPVAAFETEHDGYGSFYIESPEAGKTYTAIIGGSTGAFKTYNLPAVKAEGITMEVANNNESRLFVMLGRGEVQKVKYNTVRVVAQMHGHIVYNTVLNVEEGETTAPIPKKKLPAGILQITAFDAQNNPLAERLVFIGNYEAVKPIVQLDTANFKARGKNKYSFKLDDIGPSSVSVAVTNGTIDGAINGNENILSSFMLTSDLKGYIHQPGYYFANKDSATLHHLDLLLMTHGWRRFDWKKILTNQNAVLKFPVESAMSLRGTVTKSDSKNVIKDGKVTFIIKGDDSTTVLAEAKLTDKGEFLVSDVNFLKKASVAYMGTNNKSESFIVDVHMEPAYIDSLKKSKAIPSISLDTTDITNRKNAWANFLQGNINSLQSANFDGFNNLGNVTVKNRRRPKEDSLNAEYAGGPFLMGKGIDPNDYKQYSNVWQIIQAAVPGIRVEGDFFNPIVSFNRFDNLDVFNRSGSETTILSSSSGDAGLSLITDAGGVTFFLNEVNVPKDVISTLNAKDIALIKVLKTEGAAIGAPLGAIIIYTTKGAVINKGVYDKSFTKISREGYAISRHYYAPDYERNPELSKSVTDKRFTLYWNPNIKPSKDGTYRFSFYNSDLPTMFKLIIQGIDKDGQLVHHEQVIKP